MTTYGEGTLYLRGATWWCQFWHGGKRVRRSTGTTSKAQALKFLRKQQAAADAGGVTDRSVRLDDLWALLEADYRLNKRRSLPRARQAWANVTALLGNPRAALVDGRTTARYATDRQAAGAQPATIKYELATLRRAYQIAARDGVVGQVPPVPSIDPKNARRVFFTDAETDRLLAQLPPEIADVVMFANLTGWRRQEILALRWADVDPERGVLQARETKNSEPREFPYAADPELAGLIARRRALADLLETGRERVPWVFHRAGKPIKQFRRVWATACKAAGLEGRRLHDFRRTFTRRAAEVMQRDVAKRLTGHKTDIMFTRYNITEGDQAQAAVARMAEARAAKRGT